MKKSKLWENAIYCVINGSIENAYKLPLIEMMLDERNLERYREREAEKKAAEEAKTEGENEKLC